MEEAVEILKYLGISGAAGIIGAGALLMLRFIFRKFSDESAAAQLSEAKTDVIKVLRAEVARCQEHRNRVAELSSEVSRMHSEILELRKINLDLRAELEQLRKDNELLAAKIHALNPGLEAVTGEWRANG